MIYVTAGHERGIGTEVFLNAFELLSSSQQKQFHFIVPDIYKDLIPQSLNHTLIKSPYSQNAMDLACELCSESDILVTMPTTKDQLMVNGVSVSGHTEYFRKKYGNNDIVMFFKSKDANVLLITDHIALKDVAKNINKELIHNKISLCVNKYEKYFDKLNNIIITGINPHAGEDGILGNEEIEIHKAIEGLDLKQVVTGPLPADGLFINNDFRNEDLYVYMYHDQGLAPFKSLYKSKGANITLGLPFLRLSVDHGTAFDLYGKGIADYTGCYFVLKQALRAHNEK